MACFAAALTPETRAKQQTALDRLESALALGTVTATISTAGALAFRNWKDNDGLSDVCAYRALSARNSPAMRRAIARAQVTSGNTLNARAVATGTHSHDGGKSWHAGH